MIKALVRKHAFGHLNNLIPREPNLSNVALYVHPHYFSESMQSSAQPASAFASGASNAGSKSGISTMPTAIEPDASIEVFLCGFFAAAFFTAAFFIGRFNNCVGWCGAPGPSESAVLHVFKFIRFP